MDNTGLRLKKGSIWPHGHRTFTRLIQERPSDCRVLSGVMPLQSQTLESRAWANRERIAIAHYFHDVLHRRMIWVHDRDTGPSEHWRSFFPFDAHPPGDLHGDCEDYALTWLEGLAWVGVDLRHLLFLTCLGKLGQRRVERGESTALSDHHMGGIVDDAGDIWLINSDRGRNIPSPNRSVFKWQRTQDTEYQWHLMHQLSDPHGDWFEVETYPED